VRILVYLISEKNITIRQSYNNILQGLIYQFLDKMDANWLHDNGFESGSRNLSFLPSRV